MPQKPSTFPALPAAVVRYGLAALTVVVALGLALLLSHFDFRGIEFPLFLMAIAITVWYAGTGPAIVALVLSSLAFNYYFTEPLHTFYVNRSDFPYYVMFILFAMLLTWFSSIRRRVERELLESRDVLAQEVIIRTRQANLLNLTHDTIFVRGMDDVITYWNRGAEGMYGVTSAQALGKRSHDLLRTTFPIPIDQIQEEVLRAGRWEGELRCDFETQLRHPFDIVLADYTLPSFDGFSALKIARELRPDLPFIFLSGTMNEEIAIEAVKMGATDYVFKTRLGQNSSGRATRARRGRIPCPAPARRGRPAAQPGLSGGRATPEPHGQLRLAHSGRRDLLV
ncbi:MAG TPA: DUF4118 domain-containing protein [Terriglobales bacterium]|nr:DUF4118 domain-containing protein [Terriglobales bacterium]